MFSKEESAKLRKEFWTAFGKSFPKKWILYNTKIKGFSFKFIADRKKAMVVIDLEHSDEIANQLLYDQLLTFKSILTTQYIPTIIYDNNYQLENGKTIHRIYTTHQQKFSIYNKNTWQSCYEFFVKEMTQLEFFFIEYQDIIKQTI